MPETSKERENNFKELLSKWEDKVVFNSKNQRKLEDNFKGKEERALLSKLQS